MNIPEIKRLKIAEFQIDKTNPNEMSDQQFLALKENIKKFGFIVPVITNQDYLIADGEHRFKAARDLGFEELPAVVLPLKEVDRLIIRQVMNKLKGEHNPELDLADFKLISDAEGAAEFNKLTSMDLNALMNKETAEENIPLDTVFQIVIDCADENNQKEIYDKISGLGLKCRLLTL